MIKGYLKRLIISSGLVYLFLYLPFLDQIPRVVIDEPWLAGTAHHLAKAGQLLNPNVGFSAEGFFMYPALLSVWFKCFGTHLWSMRLFSVLCGLISLSAFLKVIEKTSVKFRWFFVLLFISGNSFFVLFRWGRPEALILCFLALSFYGFDRWQKSRRVTDLVLASSMVSCAVLTHPIGGLILVAYWIVFVQQLDRSQLLSNGLAFLIPQILACLLMAWVVVASFDMSLLQYMVMVSQETGRALGKGSGPLANLLDFAKQYSLGFKRSLILIVEIGVVLLGLRSKNSTARLASWLALIYFCFAIVLFQPFVRRYFSVVSYLSLISLALQFYDWRFVKGKLKMLVSAVIILFTLNHLAGDIYLMKLNSSNQSYRVLEFQLSSVVKPDETVFSFLELWFPFKDQPFYSPTTNWNKKGYHSMQEFLDLKLVDVLILSPYMKNITSATTGDADSRNTVFSESYDSLMSLAQRSGRLRTSFSAEPFGEIQVWELNQD